MLDVILASALVATQPPAQDIIAFDTDGSAWWAVVETNDGITVDAAGNWEEDGGLVLADILSGDWTAYLTDDLDLATVYGPPTFAQCVSSAVFVCGGRGNICALRWRQVRYQNGDIEHLCEFSCGRQPCPKQPMHVNPLLDPPHW